MIRTVWFWIVTVPATAFFSTVSIAGGLVRAPAALHDWVHRWWGRTELWAAGVRTDVAGLANVSPTAPQIFVANHQSIFDIFAILAYVPASVRFVAKRELGRIPVFSLAMRAAGHVFIDRHDRRGATEAMRAAGDRMKRERLSLGLFPEGTRSKDGRLGEFKRGTFALAIETQVPIVPVAVDGGHRVARRGRIRAGTMRLALTKPLPTEGRTAEERDEVMSVVRGSISAMLEAGREPASSGGATGGPA
ncbi:MAG: lysophospholipid acyltransferase family protein [Candidatus Palauibacterales bacterium]|nr:lysophospholipid acyltransferase family protein [Candidatus Palauibacterales bacterium]MDP2483023.1 lysophospholipid acyltransferase family protein [Candidatus Palauibacterales bacterium]